MIKRNFGPLPMLPAPLARPSGVRLAYANARRFFKDNV